MQIQDPIYGSIELDASQERLLHWAGMQRLRYIRQEGVAELTFPALTHSRLSHALGSAHLATQIFDTVVSHPAVGVPESKDEQGYWRRVIRVAALLRHVAAFPFSTEEFPGVLPKGMTVVQAQSSVLRTAPIIERIDSFRPPLLWEDLHQVVTGFTDCRWRLFLNQMLASDPMGAEGLDRAIRNQHSMGCHSHEHEREAIVAGLRAVAVPEAKALVLGLHSDALSAMENHCLSRFLYAKQVLAHPDHTLHAWNVESFLKTWLKRHFRPYYRSKWSLMRKWGFPGGDSLERFFEITDDQLHTAWAKAAKKGDVHARSLQGEASLIYLGDLPAILREQDSAVGSRVYHELISLYGRRHVVHMSGRVGAPNDFPLIPYRGATDWAFRHSEVFKDFQKYSFDYFYVSQEKHEEAKAWYAQEIQNASCFRPRLKRVLKRIFKR